MIVHDSIQVQRGDEMHISGRPAGGVAISFVDTSFRRIDLHLYEGAMFELFNRLKAHIEGQEKLPRAANVVRLQ